MCAVYFNYVTYTLHTHNQITTHLSTYYLPAPYPASSISTENNGYLLALEYRPFLCGSIYK